MVRSALGGCLLALSLSSGQERVPMPLLVLLLFRMVGGTFVSVAILVFLASGTIKNCPNHLLA
jgi:hypothetical protein